MIRDIAAEPEPAEPPVRYCFGIRLRWTSLESHRSERGLNQIPRRTARRHSEMGWQSKNLPRSVA